MKAIDTNVLVRLLVRDDPAQVERAERFIANGAWVSQIVLVETMWVLRSVYSRDRVAIGLAVAMLLEHAQITLQERDIVVEALHRFQVHKGVGFSDCLISAVARKAGHGPTGTFDKALAQLVDVELV